MVLLRELMIYLSPLEKPVSISSCFSPFSLSLLTYYIIYTSSLIHYLVLNSYSLTFKDNS